MKEVRVSSWNELHEHLFVDAWRPQLERFRSPFAFRGQQDAAQGLVTSLVRLGGNFVEMERHLLRNFRKYACLNQVETDSVWNWLSLAKHHGLPTRLLDWSFSPFVALHFATADTAMFHADAAVWAVNYTRAHQFLPAKLADELRSERSDVFTIDMLLAVVKSLEELDHLAEQDFVVFFEPPSLDQRITNQFSLFSLISNPRAILDDWVVKHPDLFFKIVIPAELKWEVRDKLDQANITERVLFPGLDGLSAWLKRQYSPRRPG